MKAPRPAWLVEAHNNRGLLPPPRFLPRSDAAPRVVVAPPQPRPGAASSRRPTRPRVETVTPPATPGNVPRPDRITAETWERMSWAARWKAHRHDHAR
jgi:hypothetical protein